MKAADWITASAARAPHQVALRCDGGELGYAALDHRVATLARALHASGVAATDCVAWLGLNSHDMLAMLLACTRLGAVFMPLNWRLAAPEHRWMLHECPPSVLCVDACFVAASAEHGIAPAGTRCIALGGAAAGWTAWDDFIAQAGAVLPRGAAVDANAPALLCWTSGSTGRPKGVLLSHDALAANADASVDMHAMTPHDRVLTTLPLFHVGGLNIQTLPALREGCSVTLHARFDADATFDAIERERITLTVLVPAQLEALLAHPRWAGADLGSLRMISTGSTLVPPRLIQAVHARGIPLVQVWGATETAPIAACLHADEALRKAGTAGRAARGCELRVVDAAGCEVASGVSGEVLVRGRSLMRGYWRAAQASARALAGGWYHSGDSGHIDAEGFLTIDGRLRDMIISGGENISPAEIERVLLECPDIAEAAVVGRPDARWGEAAVAVVVAAPGARLTREHVLGACSGRLARFKLPKDVLFVDALPRTALGKVRKEALRQLVAAPPGRRAAAHEERNA